jgi:hypothetical protein
MVIFWNNLMWCTQTIRLDSSALHEELKQHQRKTLFVELFENSLQLYAHDQKLREAPKSKKKHERKKIRISSVNSNNVSNDLIIRLHSQVKLNTL